MRVSEEALASAACLVVIAVAIMAGLRSEGEDGIDGFGE